MKQECTNMPQLERRFVKASSISDRLKCVICMEVFTQPTRLFCGHTFCYDCLQSSLKSNKNCPNCRTPVNKNKVGKDLMAFNIISELLVYCPYEQCTWKGELQLVEVHLHECLLHDPSAIQAKENANRYNKVLPEFEDESVEDKINEMTNNGSLLTRALQNDNELKSGAGYEIARKLLRAPTAPDEGSKSRKKGQKQEVKADRDQMPFKQEISNIDFFEELFDE